MKQDGCESVLIKFEAAINELSADHELLDV